MARWSNLIDWTFDNSGLTIDFAPYQQSFDIYRRGVNEVPLSAKEIVDDLFETYGFKESERQREFLIDLIGRLPQEFRFGTKTGDQVDSTFMSRVNLLTINSLFQEAWNSVSNDLPSKQNADKFSAIIQDVDKEIEQKYVDLEVANTGASNQLTNDQLLATLGPQVRSYKVDSPFARAANASTEMPSESSVTPTLDENLPGAFQKTIPSTGMDIQTYEDFIKINPGSGIVDLAKIEVSGELSFNDSFDASFFKKWMPEAGDVVAINAATTTADAAERMAQTAEKPKSTTVQWNAYQALDFIYGLEESNNREAIAEIQSIMRQAGYYQGRAVEDSVVMPAFRPGYLDDATIEAWQLFLTDAARKNLSPSRLLFEQKRSRYNQRLTGEGIPQIDPFERDATVQQFAMNVLGRALNDEETNKVLKYVMQLERESATLGVMESDPDSINFSARVTDFIRRSNEDEARLIYADEQKKAWEGLFGT